ncbi:hypothetical protein B0T26DRAFT_680617 [Lasiosphaeria miniovina]|uniref:Uncharacterized protein n=1 Tax=Lasiosphaeria miniovina TaxID=1954250 RepID=A0AA40A0I7_9PEZI|nr:uncharacterized protein B0T26DRAFT_680617 [Lasiosphaeria miniovina]KAK0707038.1 hypothetical protein B0T26DRAFT_680617 [Lasiosphaeria miniovina]
MNLAKNKCALANMFRGNVKSVELYLDKRRSFGGLMYPKDRTKFHSSLAALTKTLSQLRQLQNLSIRDIGVHSYNSYSAFLNIRNQDVMSRWATGGFVRGNLARVFSASDLTITNLCLDVVGEYARNGCSMQPSGHFCRSVGILLGSIPTLKKFHCRTAFVCKCLLDTPERKSNQPPLALEEVLVSLCFVGPLGAGPKLYHSRGCRFSGYRSNDTSTLIRHMGEQATKLAGKLPNLKTVKVLSWKDTGNSEVSSGTDVYAFDAVTGRRTLWTKSESYKNWSWDDPRGEPDF